MGDDYHFADLPLADIQPGTSILLNGPTHAGTRELGYRLLAGQPGEGAIAITTNQRAARLVAELERVGLIVSEDRTAILDCVGEEDGDIPARILPVSGPADLTGIGMRFSDVYQAFEQDSIQRVRTGLCSVSTLLTFSNLRPVSRFLHTLVGRVDSVDGLGVFRTDSDMQDAQSISTLAQFCAGRIDVRDSPDGPELPSRGLPGQPHDWTPFDLSD